jgi:hypothetical protein
LVRSAVRGVAPEYDEHGSVRVIKTANVRRFALSSTPAQYVSESFALASPRAVVPQYSLLVTGTGVGSAGRAIVKLSDTPMVADAHVTVLGTTDLESAAFLCAYLQSPIGRQQLLRHRRGSSRQIEIYPEDILSVLVPRVPDRQRASIAARWLRAAERVEGSAGALLEAERRLVGLIGEDATSAGDDWGKGWMQRLSTLDIGGRRIDAEFHAPAIQRLRYRLMDRGGVPLSELIVSARKGVQPETYSDDGSVHVIKSKDVQYPELDLSSCERTTDEEWPYRLAGGEVLVNTTGQGTLGRSTVVPASAAERLWLIPSVDIYALEVDRSRVVPEYVALFLNSAPGRRLTEALQTGSSGQQHLYPAHFTAIPIPIPRTTTGQPDLDWQRETVRIAEARTAALAAARETGALLDQEFVDLLGVPVDMAIVPF